MMSRALVDVAMEGKLDLEEFIAASYLIDERKAGKSIPISLPSDLLQKLQPIIKYKNIFKKLDPSNTGFATGDKVRELFLTFGISIPELRTIWLKCDKEAAGKLNEAQFIDAMGLCYVTILGSKFTPNQIKSELIPSTPVTPKSLKDETVLSPKSTPSNESLPSRFGDNSDSVLETTYKGALAVASTYHPTLGCAEYLRSQRAELGVARIDFMLRECEIYLESCSEEMMKPLDVNEMMAIALYTYDLKEIKPDDNFYFIFNSMLRNRDPHALHIWKGYLYYLFKALQKLPDISVTTYKGATVDHNLIRSNYKKGRKIHWSGFSSTTTDLSIAKRFAAASKLLFRIEVLEGKDIQKFSFFKKEKEILLNPNINFVVTRELELEGDGFYYVNLLQMAATSSVVDFGKK